MMTMTVMGRRTTAAQRTCQCKRSTFLEALLLLLVLHLALARLGVQNTVLPAKTLPCQIG
jgi:hypothetical protein